MFLTRPSSAWVGLLTKASVACLPANRLSEVFDDPHLRARDLLHSVDHPTEGTVKVETEVRWIRENSALTRADGATGMGVRFINLSPEATGAITKFLSNRDSLYYDDE